MGKPAEEMDRPDCGGIFAQASQMIAALLSVSSLEHIEDVDAYVGSLEAVVFELIARRVDRASRCAARAAYRQGIATGFRDSAQRVSRDALPGASRHSQRQVSPQLTAIRQAGEEHGRAIRLEIARGRAMAHGD
ncbi:hypothetical protein [Burkholderia anthina]|uniref:Uncharacterized protein n=1 Tax=Burkholderia anthina TaxID=179879 RepID=A0ABS2BDY0_9BURK|nr:hypothetical protein [Burkholderia anthina]MBM2771045.1 hypothetical protein [Burkholderia anthina]QTD92068.1 hypothetical protein J4G50_27890 [Burkholderia anthina]